MFGRKKRTNSDENLFLGNWFSEQENIPGKTPPLNSVAEKEASTLPSEPPFEENSARCANGKPPIKKIRAHTDPVVREKGENRSAANSHSEEPKPQKSVPDLYQSLDLTKESLVSFLQNEGTLPKEEIRETPQKKEDGPTAKLRKHSKMKKKGKVLRDISRPPLTGEEMVKASLDGMYDVYRNPTKNKKKTLTAADYVRYGILFVCIFGFLSAGFFVFQKLYGYYRSYVVYSGLQEMVSQKDFFAAEYLKKASVSLDTLTPAEVLEGKTPDGSDSVGAYTEEQETLVGKIAQLKKINPDTAGWITIKGTVVNYPLVWSENRNYYLRRDFYGKVLSGGSIFIDERNDPDLTQNRNTVIYGHNMSDGSMFASIHDFSNASVFYGTTIEIATQDGIFVYTPFSVHSSNAFDNYFETNFVSDEDFLDFCEQMQFISLYETDLTFNKNSQIITLSTCMDDQTATENRFAVHAVLTKVIR